MIGVVMCFIFLWGTYLLGTLTGLAGALEGTPSTGHDRQIGAAVAAPENHCWSENQPHRLLPRSSQRDRQETRRDR